VNFVKFHVDLPLDALGLFGIDGHKLLSWVIPPTTITTVHSTVDCGNEHIRQLRRIAGMENSEMGTLGRGETLYTSPIR
jgi:hypothetical protein